MDEFYNIAKAKDTIQKLSEESTKTNKYHLSRIIKEGSQMMNVSFQKDNGNFVWCLVKGVAEESEELVFACIDMTHIEDNEVQYFKANINNKGKWWCMCGDIAIWWRSPDTVSRFQQARPRLFRIGDIVEVQCSVIISKAKGTKHRMKLILRAI
ncbi:hypothetical protein IW261DRAFT_1427107 [Armillaria novae-zelandiae]|uniref:Uncharacterized protein n=1 Tax=Armillaria novae-zelandiae TaxID=153914 RepID=A0AA39NHG7_9AGAR|nr:hypothetical protein IW261DRAFT_1427107 [Armillaria novae-zelandiae]